MVRFPCCDQNENLRKGAWTKEEDERLINYIRRHGQGSWKSIPRAAGLLRCGKSCRLRWINYLRPDLKRGNFTREEDDLIINLQTTMGNKWSTIASSLPGRTDNEIKNYWNTHLKRRLEDRDISQPQPKNNISTISPPIQHAQYFTVQSDIAINPMVHNIFNVRKPNFVISTSDYSSSNNNTFLSYNQEIKPEVNLELSMNLPQSSDAMKINDKFKLEKKWEIHYPQLFGKSLAASSAASSSVWPIAQEPVCLCYNLGGYLNGDNTCNKCQRVNVTDGAGDR